jgi:CheY-like chemotaxis protein
VALHGGIIVVESQEGRGSRFIVTLPWHDSETAGAAIAPQRNDAIHAAYTAGEDSVTEPPATERRGSGPLILLVSDDQPTVQMISDYLLFHHYRVSAVGSETGALAGTGGETPALILLDIEDPMLAKQPAITKLQRQAALMAIPVVCLITHDFVENVSEKKTAICLRKPARLNELVKTIDSQLGSINQSGFPSVY